MKRKRGSTKTKKKLTQPGKVKAKKKAKVQIVRRQSTRLAALHNPAIKPVLRFTSSYTGVNTQKLNEAQDIKFQQTATLTMTAGAPHDITHYYVFRQQVKDSFDFESGETQALGAFAQDGPYGPDYENAVITTTKTAIVFEDTPGFSTDRKVASGKWLESYDVHFRWTVADKNGNTWTSPEVHHQMTSVYSTGADVAVTAVPEGDHEWEVNLPDRAVG